jgi:hypothetical protein
MPCGKSQRGKGKDETGNRRPERKKRMASALKSGIQPMTEQTRTRHPRNFWRVKKDLTTDEHRGTEKIRMTKLEIRKPRRGKPAFIQHPATSI